MYRRPKFLEELLEIREQMSRDAHYDADLFAERVRSGKPGQKTVESKIRKKPFIASKIAEKSRKI